MTVSANLADVINRLFPHERLPPVAHARLLVEAKALYEEVHPKAKKGAAQGHAERCAHGLETESVLGFTNYLWAQVNGRRGWSKSSIKEAVSRGTRIATSVLDRVEGGKFETNYHLNELAKQPGEARQMALLDRWENDRLPPIPSGARFQDDDVELLCADSRERMGQMIARGEKADLVLVDPPYGYNREVRGLPAMTDDEEGSLWAVEQMVRLLKPRGYLAMWVGDKTAGEFAAAITRAGLPILQFVRWEKPNKPSWLAREYLIIAGYAARPSLTTLCCDTLANDHPLREVHPSPKPAELMVPVVEALCRPGDLVADFFMGTAPVGVAAVKTGRRYLGVELAPKYFDAARKEVEGALRQRQPLLLAA